MLPEAFFTPLIRDIKTLIFLNWVRWSSIKNRVHVPVLRLYARNKCDQM
jgi:hypothetical protein